MVSLTSKMAAKVKFSDVFGIWWIILSFKKNDLHKSFIEIKTFYVFLNDVQVKNL